MFKLFMGRFGNGVLVCNSAVMEYGDYKKIAHISPGGNITWYENQGRIPDDDIRRIKDTAKQEKAMFQRNFEMHDDYWQFQYMLERFNNEKFLYYTSEDFKRGKTFEQRVREMRNYYYTIA